MLLEELNQAISDMNEIQVLSQNKQNYDTRKFLDDNFYKYVIYTTTYIHCLEYASNYLGNKISNEDIDNVLKLLDKYQVFINEDKKYKDYLDSCKKDYDVLQRKQRLSWDKYYPLLTNDTKNTLHVIKELNSSNIDSCLNKILNAHTWTNKLSELKELKDALEDADEIIKSLNLDKNIETFLRKMNSHQANINDLNEEVLNWIRENNVGSKIKLSFK